MSKPSPVRAAKRSASSNRVFQPGQPWLDTAGRRIEAHGGGILLHQGRYWWHGEDHAHGLGNKTGIHAYSSTDLLNWTDEGVALPASALPEVYRDRGACERPKVLFNASTGKFVMWMHLDGDPSGVHGRYSRAEAGIAVADAPQGPFTLVRTGRPIQHDFGQSEDWTEQKSRGPTYRDMALFQDDDGSAYVFYAAEGNPTMYVARLRDDFQWVQEPTVLGKTWSRSLIGLEREAPAPFKHAGKYHLLSSACTGWGPNPAMHAVADHPLGPWTVVGDPCRGHASETTFRSQPTFVLPAPGKPPGSFIYLADRWIGHQLETSSYVWLPFTVGADQRVTLDFHDRWNLQVFDRPATKLSAPKARAARGGAELAWSAVTGATLYHVYRNGEHLGSTAATRFVLPPMLAGRVHGYSVVAASLAATSPASKPVAIATPRARDCWLSEYEADAWQQGWGSLRRDLSAAQDSLKLGDRAFTRGLGTHAVSRIVYRLGGHYGRLDAWVGIQRGVSGGKVAFRIVGDGRVLADSGPMVATDGAKRLVADLRGVHELALVVDEAGQGHHYGHGNWCDPKLTAR
jgi:hypothetical protein